MACVFEPPPSMPITMNVMMSVPRAAFAVAPCVSEERIPTKRVMVVPINTYQGQAMREIGASAGANAGTAARDLLREHDHAHGGDPDRHAEDRVALHAPVARK